MRTRSTLLIFLICLLAPASARAMGAALPIPFLGLPSLDRWAEKPADLFLVPASQFDRITRLKPYGGAQAGGCRQPYGSFDLKAATSLITPVEGKVSEITYCGRDGSRDWLGLAILFARHDGSPVELVVQVYPADRKFSCSEGRDRFDNGLFASWLGVQEGKTLEAGTPLVKSDGATEVRFFLRDPDRGRVACPGLFAERIVRDLVRRAPSSTQSACPALLRSRHPLCLKASPQEDWLDAASAL